MLASEADAVAIVIKTGAATRKALKLALSQLERVDVQVCGVVLNDVDITRLWHFPEKNPDRKAASR